VEISPKPDSRYEWIDCFGNESEFFSIEHLHPSLTVTAKSIVERSNPIYALEESPSWKEVVSMLRAQREHRYREATEFIYDSRHCQSAEVFADYAKDVVDENRSFIECVRMLMSKIYVEFEYSTEATHVSTEPAEALEKRQGVCQDFAHVAICCLRSLGIPSRYVSGYLLTNPAPGKEKLVGADASHAWFSVYGGPIGWIDFDPTNNLIPGVEHITVAWGRDYADVAPIHGVFIGGGFTLLSVSVDVQPMDRLVSED
jgi:transglutaminase-like putative cysteine protease